MTRITDILVDKQNVRRCEVRTFDAPELAEGEALLRIDTFSLTSNNVTYAALGEPFGYWRFFPAADGWGRVPVWGYADVAASRAAGLEVGERIFGYYPMASHLIVKPTQVKETGFVDGAPHRADLPPAYNQYARTRSDPAYVKADEPYAALLRPLFITSFLLDNHLASNAYFGAEQVALTSASSKTALSLAYLLSRRREVRVLGLTSPGNRAFVESLGYYNAAIAYEDIAKASSGPTVVVDFAGDAAVVRAVHGHFGASLRASIIVGATHWEEGGDLTDLSGPQRAFFFAPDHVRQRMADWGQAEFQARYAKAQHSFFEDVRRWLRVDRAVGPEATIAAFRDAVDGRLKPDAGIIRAV